MTDSTTSSRQTPQPPDEPDVRIVDHRDPEHRFIVACRQQRTAEVRKWLADGVDLDVVEADHLSGSTPLTASLGDPPHAVTRLLLEAGANPDVLPLRGEPCLHFAAARHFDALLEMTLDAGADPCLHDADGRIAWALAQPDSRTRQILEARGGGPSLVQARHDELKRLIQRLSDDGLEDPDRFAPLADHPAATELLWGTVIRCQERTFLELIELGFPVPEGAKGVDMLADAAARGCLRIVDYLLQLGFRGDDRTTHGDLPLFRVLSMPPTPDALAAARRLMAAGSPVVATDSLGDTLRARARRAGWFNLLDELPARPDEPPLDPEARDVARLRIPVGSSDEGPRWVVYRPNDPLSPLSLVVDYGRDGEDGWVFTLGEAKDLRTRPWSELPDALKAWNLEWLLPLADSWRRGQPLPFSQVLELARRHGSREPRVEKFRQ